MIKESGAYASPWFQNYQAKRLQVQGHFNHSSAPAARRLGGWVTSLNSHWKFCAKMGPFWMELNRLWLNGMSKCERYQRDGQSGHCNGKAHREFIRAAEALPTPTTRCRQAAHQDDD